MRVRLRLCGFTVCSLTFDAGPALEILEDAPQGLTGGSGHNFERDVDPLNPSREEPWYDDRRFGFQ